MSLDCYCLMYLTYYHFFQELRLCHVYSEANSAVHILTIYTFNIDDELS